MAGEGLKLDLLLDPQKPGLLSALWKIQSTQSSGLLTIEWERFKKQILFRNGEPVATRSNWAQEAFGNFLARSGKLSAALIKEELKAKEEAQSKVPLGEWLVQRGHLQGGEVNEVLEAHFRDRLFNLLTQARGSLNFRAVSENQIDSIDFESMRLSDGFSKLLWEATKKSYTEAFCKTRLTPFGGRAVELRSTQFLLPLPSQEFRAWNQLVQTKNIPNFASLDTDSLRLLTVHWELGQVEWGVSQDERLAVEIENLLKKFEKAAPHEILGVEPGASIDLCKKSFNDLIKKHHPDRLPPSAAKLRPKAEMLFARINQSFSTMTDPEKRKEYDAELELEKSGGKEAIEEKLKAEMEFGNAKMALKRRHFGPALESLERVVKVLNEDGEILSDKTYAELMVAMEKKADPKALSMKLHDQLKKAVQLNPHYSFSHYYRGLILKWEGKLDQALEAFDQALEKDPKLVEASSEARVLRMRKDKKK